MVIAEPNLSFDFDVSAGGGRWIRHGNHALWCGNRTADEPSYVLHEWEEKGVRPFPVTGTKPVFHRVPEGTPYHISHLFGFWIVNDVDALLLILTHGIRTGAALYFEAALVVGMLGFVSTVALAKFLLRGEVIE